MTLALVPYPRFRATTDEGVPLAGGLLYSYLATTSTPQALLTSDGSTSAANPVVLDAQGEADIRLAPYAYKLVLKTSAGVELWSCDNVSSLAPTTLDDYSLTVAQMRLTTDPGEIGTESQATSMSGELERLRFAQYETKVALDPTITYWYETPAPLELLNAATYFTAAELADIKARTRLVNVRTAVQAIFTAIVASTVPLRVIFPAGDYYLGTGTSGTNFLALLSPPPGTTLIGHGATFVCETLSPSHTTAETQLIYLRNPRRFRMEGFHFTDVGFTSDYWVTTGAQIGAFGIYIVITVAAGYSTSNPCTDVVFDQITGENLQGLCYTRTAEDDDSLAYALQDVSFRSCRAKNCYYGITLHFIKNTRIELDVLDVRRAIISYCARDGKWDVNSAATAGFAGSNAHIEIAWTNLFGPTDPALTSVDNLDVTLRVSGVEAHSALMHFYHQGNDAVSHGAMRNIRATLQYSSMTATGRHQYYIDNLVPMHLFRFDHEYPAGTVKATTLSTWDQISLDGGFVPENGAPSNSGLAVTVQTTPAVLGYLELGAGFYPPYWDLANVCNTFKLRRGHGRTTFTPVVAGSTGAGSGTYSVQTGSVEVIDGRVYFSLQLTWSAHTGTGNMLITGLPLTVVSGLATVQLTVLYAGTTAVIPGTDYLLTAQLQNTGINILRVTQSTGALAAYGIPAAGTFAVSGSYPIV